MIGARLFAEFIRRNGRRQVLVLVWMSFARNVFGSLQSLPLLYREFLIIPSECRLTKLQREMRRADDSIFRLRQADTWAMHNVGSFGEEREIEPA